MMDLLIRETEYFVCFHKIINEIGKLTEYRYTIFWLKPKDDLAEVKRNYERLMGCVRASF